LSARRLVRSALRARGAAFALSGLLVGSAVALAVLAATAGVNDGAAGAGFLASSLGVLAGAAVVCAGRARERELVLELDRRLEAGGRLELAFELEGREPDSPFAHLAAKRLVRSGAGARAREALLPPWGVAVALAAVAAVLFVAAVDGTRRAPDEGLQRELAARAAARLGAAARAMEEGQEEGAEPGRSPEQRAAEVAAEGAGQEARRQVRRLERWAQGLDSPGPDEIAQLEQALAELVRDLPPAGPAREALESARLALDAARRAGGGGDGREGGAAAGATEGSGASGAPDGPPEPARPDPREGPAIGPGDSGAGQVLYAIPARPEPGEEGLVAAWVRTRRASQDR
jgi:hypothetical protein